MFGKKWFSLAGFVPLFLLLTIMEIFDLKLISELYFLLTYCWHYALVVPELESKALSYSYRFSFLSAIFHLNNFIQNSVTLKSERFKTYLPSICRMISPLVFCTTLSLITFYGNILFSILGTVVFEGCYLLHGHWSRGLKRNE